MRFVPLRRYSSSSSQAAEERRRESFGDHWRVSSRNDSMSTKSHFDRGSEQRRAPSQSRVDRRSTHFEFARNGRVFGDASRCIGNIPRSAVIHCALRAEGRGGGGMRNVIVERGRAPILPTTKGKTGREIDTRRLPDTHKCGKVLQRGGQTRPGGGG